MNNKVLVTIKVPMIERTYDIYVPISKNIKVIKGLLVDTIHELSEGHFPKKQSVILMRRDGTVLNDKLILKDCNIKNGYVLTLI